MYFSEEELKGVPSDVVSGYEKRSDGLIGVTHKTPDIFPLVSLNVFSCGSKLLICFVCSSNMLRIPRLGERLSQVMNLA